MPKDATFLIAIACLCEACTLLRNPEWTATIYRMAEPYGGRFVGIDFIFFFPLSALLGRLATSLSRWDEAAKHFEQALEICTRNELRPLRAMVQYLYAVMLVRKGGPDDLARAALMLTEVLAVAAELGMPPLVERATAIKERAEAKARAAGEAAAPDAESVPSAKTIVSPPRRRAGRFRKEGEYWEIALDGHPPILLKDSAGLRCLAHLLAHPGRDFLAVDLAAVGRVEGSGSGGDADDLAIRRDLGDAGPALDASAAAAYRRRLEELRAEESDADEYGDAERRAALRAEIEMVAEELARGLGLGGRERRVGSASERARINVTRTIKAALHKIAEHDAAAGRYLATTVRTGTYCSYTPDPIAPVDWTA